MKLQNKTAIVTGSSMGIGKVIAQHLAEHGARVILNGRRVVELENTRRELENLGLEVAAFNCDVTNPAECKKLIAFAIEQYGSLDILVNNVGVGSRGHFEDTNPEVFQYVLNSNILGVVYPTLEAMKYLKASKGSVIFISSLAGFHGMPNAAPYCMSKRALSSLAESLRIETAKDDVHVGIVYVGMTKNHPNKQVLLSDGSWKNLQPHDGVFVDTPEDTAKAVFETILNRNFRTIVGLKGKAYYWLQMLAPWLVDYTFKNRMETIETAQS
jgi:NAD(P)-dependent dehydrogenase (short-subunit alcohol dehydrogenase family)